MVLAALDVHYTDPSAVAACVLFTAWTAAAPASEHVARIAAVEPYQPGEFRKRELPCLLEALRAAAVPPEVIVIDGYAWLAPGRPGLGAHLFEALGSRIPVIGVAKTSFQGATAVEVLRGRSAKPLHVTAAGMISTEAAARVASMHGPHRLPTLLAAADRLARNSK